MTPYCFHCLSHHCFIHRAVFYFWDNFERNNYIDFDGSMTKINYGTQYIKLYYDEMLVSYITPFITEEYFSPITMRHTTDDLKSLISYLADKHFNKSVLNQHSIIKDTSWKKVDWDDI